jgi:hypothetical protein
MVTQDATPKCRKSQKQKSAPGQKNFVIRPPNLLYALLRVEQPSIAEEMTRKERRERKGKPPRPLPTSIPHTFLAI